MKTLGVQLGKNSMNVSEVRSPYDHLCIGCSVHSVDEALFASKHGADYLLYGHVYETQSKPGLKPNGLKGLKDVVQHVSTPVIAIGGITPENTPDIIKSGASGIAVLSGVLLANDPMKNVIAYRKALRKVADDEKTL
ncbi:hypothetical protein GCM10027286_22340 [Virgibacillus ainsalahensis]